MIVMKNLIVVVAIFFSLGGFSIEVRETVYNVYSKNGKMTKAFEDLVYKQKNVYVRNLLIEAFNLVEEDIKYKYGGDSFKGIDCTNFINLLFERIGLPVKNLTTGLMTNSNAKNYYASDFEVYRKKKVKYFQPKTGDILAYNGHAVIVIDPQNCIAVNSAAWTAGNGPEGVQFHQITDKSRCANGKWLYWDIKDGSHDWEVLFRQHDIAR